MADRTEPDLDALRQALAVDHRDLEVSRARARALLDAGLTAPARRPAPRWVPALAAAVVLAVTLSVVGYLRRPAAEPVSELPTIDVAAAFDRLAAAAADQLPLTVADDQVLFVRSDGVMASSSFMIHYRYDAWADPDGMRWLLARRYEERLDTPLFELRGDRLNTPVLPADDLRVAGPAALAALPTDPAAMRSRLATGTATSRGDWTVEQGIWEAMHTVLGTADPFLPPAVRAALYHALAGLPGVTAVPIDIGGRPVVSFRQNHRGTLVELLFDERSGRYVGHGSGGAGHPPPTATRSPVPDVPLDAGIQFRVLVTCTAVDRDQLPA
jgi:hypothetical protein